MATGEIEIDGKPITIKHSGASHEIDKFFLRISRAKNDDEIDGVILNILASCLNDSEMILCHARNRIMGREAFSTSDWEKASKRLEYIMRNHARQTST